MPYDPAAPQPRTVRLANARIVLGDEVIRGGLLLRDGRIAGIDTGAARASDVIDCEGDHLIPGLVELHTDNLERHLQPRPDAHWPPAEAITAHDAEMAGVGITTVFDALRVGSITSRKGGPAKYAREIATLLAGLRARGTLRVDHRLHLRAEICSETLTEELAEFGGGDAVGILSLMDHTPGQRQFADIAQMRRYHAGRPGFDPVAFEAHLAAMVDLTARNGAAHRAGAIAAARRFGAVLASHDDTEAAHVAASAAAGVTLAEFPTTETAARACRAAGIAVMLGAPNLIRGGSHSGNVAAADLARGGLLDILSSDYVPSALLTGAARLADLHGDLPRAIAAVTDAPARAAGLRDRGRIAPGLRADVVRVRLGDGPARVRGVWVAGGRVA